MSKARVEGGSVVVSSTWPELKSQIDNRNINFKYQETTTAYEIAAIDGPFFYVTLIYKAGEAPQNQSTYDTWRTEFETYYKNRITDFTSTQPYFLTNVDGYSVVLKNGALPTANDGYGIGAIGYDGTNYRLLRSATDGTLRIDPTGTTTQPVSGTVTANQGTANSLANAWSTKITDTTNGPVAVKPASTSPAATDPALVVVLSPNQQIISVTTTAPNSTSSIAKGYVNTSAVTNVALYATTYTEQSSNFTGSIASSSANDTSAGTGARTVTIYYVDATGATAGTEQATLNGTTGVNLVTSTKCFIEKITVDTVGSGGSNAGTISLYTGANKTGTVVVTIAVGDNQTYLAHHYVVTGDTCNISGMTGFNNNSGNQTVFTLRSADLPVANQANLQISDWITGGLTFQFTRTYDQLIKVPGPSRITMYAAPGGTPNILNRGAFDFYDT